MLTKTNRLSHIRAIVMRVAHSFRKESGCSLSDALTWAWHYCKKEMVFVAFTKKSGEQTERLVYHSSYNRLATKGGVRTCPPEYTLHIEVSFGIADTLHDLHPLCTKWIACKGQVYTPITKTA